MFQIFSDETIIGLGRWVVSGNSQTHQLWLGVYTSTGVGVGSVAIIDSVTVDTNGATPDQFLYGYFAAPVNLPTGFCVILSNELNGGDQWQNADCFPTKDPDCVPFGPFDMGNFGPCYSLDLTGDIPANQALAAVGFTNQAYIPVSLLWDGPATDQPIAVDEGPDSVEDVGEPAVGEPIAPSPVVVGEGPDSESNVGAPMVGEPVGQIPGPEGGPLPINAITVSVRECPAITCCPTDDFSYSITSGPVYFNNEASFIVDCPEGLTCNPGLYPMTILIEEGTITWQPPTQTPGDPQVLTLQCCLGELTRTLPAGASEGDYLEAIQSLIAEAVAAQAQCDADAAAPPAGTRGRWWNDEIEQTVCTEEQGTLVVTGSIPFGIIQSTHSLKVQAHIFSSTVSKADANAQAATYLAAFVTQGLSNGSLTCGSLPRCGTDDPLGATRPYIALLGALLTEMECVAAPDEDDPDLCNCKWTNGVGAEGEILVKKCPPNVFFGPSGDGGGYWYVMHLTSITTHSTDYNEGCAHTGSFHPYTRAHYTIGRSIFPGEDTPVGEYEPISIPPYEPCPGLFLAIYTPFPENFNISIEQIP
jgi:hypothetical protein